MQHLGEEILESLAQRYPVSCGSDEFYFFPHIRLPDTDWGRWDSFSPSSVKETAVLISGWEAGLGRLEPSVTDTAERTDSSLLQRFLRTLREELTYVLAWERQPTLYLTLLIVGMIEALEAEDSQEAVLLRGRGLPAFLNEAAGNLRDVPELFRELALDMLPETREFLTSIESVHGGLSLALRALDEFERKITGLPTVKGFTLAPELYEKIVLSHFGCGKSLEEIREALDKETAEMEDILKGSAGRILHKKAPQKRTGGGWHEALKYIRAPEAGRDGIIGLYAAEVKRLAAHSVEQGFIKMGLLSASPARVAPVPAHLMSVRKASGYSISPVHPPAGGVFYLINDEPSLEMSMLTAHETYPGHHMLDTSRLMLNNPLRRAMEFPLYYEGWACFSEELLWSTGYYATEDERFILARRRLRRAARGRAELDINTGAMDIEEAAKSLVSFGFDPGAALGALRRYPLDPGYQLCYTVGLSRFLDLFGRFGGDNPAGFVRTVLREGEIGFQALEDVLE